MSNSWKESEVLRDEVSLGWCRRSVRGRRILPPIQFKTREMTEKVATVNQRTVRGAEAKLRLSNGEDLSLQRLAPVGKGDEIYRDESGLLVRLDRSDEFVRLTPAWRWSTVMSEELDVAVQVQEIVTEDEFHEFERLTHFHYRGKGGMGRSVPLIAKVDVWDLPSVVGFIELSSTFIANTARSRFLNSQFVDGERRIAWHKWDSQTAKTFSNCIVRIARCVVYPELRGLGLSRILVEAAIRFARERWHLAGLRPSFIEITAEMLRFWPFVRSAGFEYIGETEGNRHRAAKDMRYLVVRDKKVEGMPKGGGGIMFAQRAYAKTLVEVMERTGYKVEEILAILQRAPERLSNDEWVALHSVFRRPKPVYLRGLTQSADSFMRRRLPTVGRRQQGTSNPRPRTLPSSVVDVRGLRLTARSKPSPSERSRRVQEAFGIVAREHCSVLLDGLDLSLNAGEITLIGGPSGSGKSLLVRGIRYLAAKRISRGRLPAGVSVQGTLCGPQVDISLPKAPQASQCPLELLADQSFEDALEILAAAGLAEPHLYIRPSATLSTGQNYRLAIALALAKKPDLLLIDEFCEPLDRYTSMAVCRRLKRVVDTTTLGVVVATAEPMRVLEALRPDHLLLLRSGGGARWYHQPAAASLSGEEQSSR